MKKLIIIISMICLTAWAGTGTKNARWGLRNSLDKCPNNVQRIADKHPDLLAALNQHPDLIMDCLQTIAVQDEELNPKIYKHK